MQISLKIPHGKTEVDAEEINTTMRLQQIRPKSVKITKRMIHIDMGSCDEYQDAERYVADCRDAFSAVSMFLLRGTEEDEWIN